MINFKNSHRLKRIEEFIEDEIVREEIFNIARHLFTLSLENDDKIADKSELEIKKSLTLMLIHIYQQAKSETEFRFINNQKKETDHHS